MMRLLAPMLSMVFCTAALEPWPISVMAITAATPMTMPRAVSAERRALRRKARSAVRRMRKSFFMLGNLARSSWQVGGRERVGYCGRKQLGRHAWGGYGFGRNA